MCDVTQVVSRLDSDDPLATSELLTLVYEELRKLAAAKLAQERPGQTLQATALVHEAYLKLVDASGQRDFANRRHFFSAAAEAMGQILVDQARKKRSLRHGGQWRRVDSLDKAAVVEDAPESTTIVKELLDRLAIDHQRPAKVARMRLYLRMSFPEIAEVIETSSDTAEADWAYARAWLQREWKRS
jgi:RNA polymerase sigma factor (TIGR02999 family)